jgi:Ca-activated chloride channel family protein
MTLTVGTVTLLQPWAVLIPIITLLFLLLLYRRRSQPNALIIPLDWLNKGRRLSLLEILVGVFKPIAAFISVIAALIAATRPVEQLALPVEEQARSIVIALDLSRSMATQDFIYQGERTSRMEGVKLVVSDYLATRQSDRVGLVVFGAHAFLQAPLTRDFSLLKQLVSGLQVGVAGDGTAIGEGLGLAIKRVESIPAESRAIVLVTDGVNNSGDVQPLQAAQIARDLGVRVYTIGIGSDAQGLMEGGAEFDAETLQKIAEMTGGLYRDAGSFESLADIYKEIEAREASVIDTQRPPGYAELFAPFAWISFLALLVYLILNSLIHYPVRELHHG